MKNKRMHTEPTKNRDMQNKRMRVCSPVLELRNKTLRIYLSLAIRLKKSWYGDYDKQHRNNKTNKESHWLQVSTTKILAD